MEVEHQSKKNFDKWKRKTGESSKKPAAATDTEEEEPERPLKRLKRTKDSKKSTSAKMSTH